jgi:hypothetical protein
MTLSGMLLAGAAAGGLVGLLLLAPRAKGFGGVLRRLFGLLIVIAAIGFGGAGMLLRNYHWLVADVPVATIALAQQGPQRFSATLDAVGAEPRTFTLLGDEWQLDARIVRWTLPAQLGGLRPVYAFERLSGRYADPAQDQAAERSVHDLRERWDFWQFRQAWLAGLPIADARWGSATYLPMIDGATYSIYVNPQGGLVAKPADEATEAMLDEAGW